MENIAKKVGYLKGILESAKLDPETDQGKILSAMFDVVNELCDRTQSMSELLDDLNDYVESIDDDLAELEGDFPDGDFEMDDDILDFDDDDDDVRPLRVLRGRAKDDDDLDFEDEEADDEDEPLPVLRRKVKEANRTLSLAACLCPICKKMFFVSVDDPEDAEYICPHCAEQVLPLPLTSENAPVAKPVEE